MYGQNMSFKMGLTTILLSIFVVDSTPSNHKKDKKSSKSSSFQNMRRQLILQLRVMKIGSENQIQMLRWDLEGTTLKIES